VGHQVPIIIFRLTEGVCTQKLSGLLSADMINPIDYSISKFVTFAGDEVIKAIREQAEVRVFKKGTEIENRGEPVDHFYVIEEGLVQLGINGSDGSRFNLTRLGSGHTFGETAFYLNSTVIHDARAKTDVTLLRLDRPVIDCLMEESIEFSKALVAVACMRLQTTLDHIGDTLGMPLKARVAKRILSVSEGAQSENIIILKQVELAHSLGVSRVSIGKALKQLKMEGHLSLGYGKIEIIDRDKLEALVAHNQRPE
jgi:CRP/FNR family cyclic AMP-dependent transcriptional regulator